MPRKRRVGSTPSSPTTDPAAASEPRARGPDRRAAALYFAGDADSPPRPLPRATVLLEVELPPERLDAGHRRRRPPPGPPDARPRLPPGQGATPVLERVLGPRRVLDEAVEHLVEDAYREAILETDDRAR